MLHHDTRTPAIAHGRSSTHRLRSGRLAAIAAFGVSAALAVAAQVSAAPPAFGDAHLTKVDTWVGQKAGIKKVDIAFDEGPRFVAAVQKSDDHMKLFAFSTTGGNLAKLDSMSLISTATQIKIAYVPGSGGRDYYVTASRSEAGKLRLTLFELLPGGQLKWLDKRFDGETTNRLEIATVGQDEFAVAVREPSGFLRARIYEIGAGDDIEFATQACYGGAVDRLSLQVTSSALQTDLVIGARDAGTGDLKVYVFGRHPAWNFLEWVGDNETTGTPAGAVQSVSMSEQGDHLLTAVKTEGDRLKLIRWRVPSDYCPSGPCDRDVYREEEGLSGTDASNIRIAQAPNANNRYLTAHSLNSGELRVVAWQRSGGAFVRIGNNSESGESLGTADKVSIGFAQSGRAATAVRDGQDRLRIHLWHIAW